MATVFDVIILGASGHTGKYVVREFLKFYNGGGEKTLKLAIAGRNVNKLRESLIWAGGSSLLPRIPIFEADVANPDSIASLCEKTRLLISCIGPYSKNGEVVVATCVQAGIDYLDICGEPAFMERMEMKYHKQAVKNKSLIVSACGMDSIPAETGVQHNIKQFVKRGWIANSVDSYIVKGSTLPVRKGALINYGTYASLILSLANVESLVTLRKSVPKRIRPKIPGMPSARHGLVKWEPLLKLYAMKIPIADPSVVRRTQSTWAANSTGLQLRRNENIDNPLIKKRWNSLKAAHYGCYFATRSPIPLYCLNLLLKVWSHLVKYSWGKNLLLNYPELCSFGLFSKEGPSEDTIENEHFTIWFIGRGYGDSTDMSKFDKTIVTCIRGPCMGYLTTPICLVQSALTILQERDILPIGGVYTPGIAFATSSLPMRLKLNGLHCEVTEVIDMTKPISSRL